MPQLRVPSQFQMSAAVDFPVRPAEPEDSRVLATAILHASRSHLPRGLWDILIDGDDEDRLGFLELMTLLDERSFCHYTNFFVAESSGEPVAALCGFDPGDEGLIAPGFAIAIAGEQYGLTDEEVATAYRRLETYQLAVPEQLKGVWTIEWVWTAQSMRRRGLIGSLIAQILAQGSSTGHTRAQVTTFIGNTPAERAYEKFGFRVANQVRHPDFERLMGAPGLTRFERDLLEPMAM